MTNLVYVSLWGKKSVDGVVFQTLSVFDPQKFQILSEETGNILQIVVIEVNSPHPLTPCNPLLLFASCSLDKRRNATSYRQHTHCEHVHSGFHFNIKSPLRSEVPVIMTDNTIFYVFEVSVSSSVSTTVGYTEFTCRC